MERMPIGLWVGFVVLYLLCGCAPREAKPQHPEWVALRRDPRSFVAKIAALRSLPERRPTPIVFHDASSFAGAVERKAKLDGVPPTPADYIPFQVAFGLVVPTEIGGREPTSLGEVQRTEVIAFYDQFSHSVHVLRAHGDEEELPLVVAHEIGHALQGQHFRVPDVAAVTDEDTRLAQLALIEGDAMLAMLAYGAAHHHVPLTRALVRLARGAAEQNVEQYTERVNSRSALAQAPPFIRDRLSFPYLSGASFVGGLYRAGGFSLVNRSYEIPPVSSEQILHPEKYLAGELPVPVRAPEVPQCYELLVSGRVGELLLRSTLRACNDARTVESAAAGWGGDAFSIVRSGERAGLLFATIWDSEDDAKEFEAALRRTAQCWDRLPGIVQRIFPGGTVVARAGDRVSLVRGFDAATASRMLAALAQLPGPRAPAQPPFGPISIPPPRVPFRAQPSYVANGQVISQYFGLSVPLPPGFEVELDEEISLRRHGASPASLVLGISDWVFSAETVELLFRDFAQGVSGKLEGRRMIVVEPDRRATTPVGVAVARTWRLEGTALRGRLLLVPICRNTGALVISQAYADEDGRRALEWVVAGLRPLSAPSPLCAELDP